MDHEKTVLSAILPDRRDRLDEALRVLDPEHHFAGVHTRTLFQLIEKYAHRTGALLPEDILGDMLHRSNADAGRIASLTELFVTSAEQSVDDGTFIYSIQELRDLAAERQTSDAFRSAMTVLTRGMELPGGRIVRGHADARNHLLGELASIDRNLAMQDAPEGSLKQEEHDLLDEYDNRKKTKALGQDDTILFGLPAVDSKVGGFQRGELDLVVGFSGNGKTTMVTHLAWNAAVGQGKNVVVATTETLRVQVRRKVVARHSRLSKFGLREGLNTRDIRDACLTPGDEDVYRDVVSDLTCNPDYGHIYIAQVPRGATIGTLESKLVRLQRQFDIDLVIVDYLALFRSDRKRQSDREELNSILKETKQLATTFDNGRGVPIVSPWQVSRAAHQDAERTGFYTPAALAETSEATNSSDVILSLYAEESNDRYTDVTLQILKNRDGETSNGIPLRVDYATAFFTEKRHSVTDVTDSRDSFSAEWAALAV